jgi:cofilin
MTLHEDCVKDYKELQANHLYKFMTFGISEGSIRTLEKSNESDYAAFVEKLPSKECRYAVYDLDFEKPEGGRRSKIVFILWYVSCFESILPLPSPSWFLDLGHIPPTYRSPDEAKVKDKMVYAASKDALRTALPGISYEIQATDETEVDYQLRTSLDSD